MFFWIVQACFVALVGLGCYLLFKKYWPKAVIADRIDDMKQTKEELETMEKAKEEILKEEAPEEGQ